MTESLTEAQLKAAAQVEKLLRLAGRNPNEHEAAAAAAKAQQILLENNLSMSAVEAAGGEDGRREETKRAGGMYVYQRRLWRAVAELNFCYYATRTVKVRKKRRGEEIDVWSFEHDFIGRVVNVRATIALGEYLEQTCERLCRERLAEDGQKVNSQFYSRWAVSFREGIADVVVEKLEDRRAQAVSEERRKEREAQKAQADAARTGTALTIASVQQSEADLNTDFRMGRKPGETARRRAEYAAEAAAEEAAHTAWAAAHPEEARKQQEEREARWAKAAKTGPGSRGGGGPRERNKDWGAYSDGRAVGRAVGIDRQTEGGAAGARRLK